MKKLLLTTMAFLSMSAFSQDYTFQNITYPEQSIEVTCQDQACEIAKVDFFNKNMVHGPYIVLKQDLKQLINDGREPLIGPGYQMTKETADLAQERFKEAYYGKALGNALLAGGAGIIDTAGEALILPIRLFDLSRTILNIDNRVTKGAKAYIRNIDADYNEVLIKHKYYSRVYDALKAVAIEESLYSINLKYENCRLKNIDNYIQIYVNDKFRGNYKYTETVLGIIQDLESRGICHLLEERAK